MIKLLLAGFPCVEFSISQKKNRINKIDFTSDEFIEFRKTPNWWLHIDEFEKQIGEKLQIKDYKFALGLQLFFNCLVALDRLQLQYPDEKVYFLFENVSSMKKEIKVVMSEIIEKLYGGTMTEINSALVSAQNRKRIYFTNFGDIPQPEDRGILLKDIIESGANWEEKAYCLTASYNGAVPWNSIERKQHTMIAEPVCVAQRGRYTGENGEVEQHYEARDDGKTNTITTVSKDCMVAEPTCLRYERTEEGKQLRKQYENHEVQHGFNEMRTLQPRLDGKTNTITTVQKDNMVAIPLNETTGGKAQCLRATCYKDGIRNLVGNDIDRRTCVAEPIKIGEINKGGQGDRIYSVEGKAISVTSTSGGTGSNTGLYAEPVAVRCRGRKDKECNSFAKYEARSDNKSGTLDTNTVNGSMVAVPVCLQEQVHGRQVSKDGTYDRRYEAREDSKSGSLTATNRQNAVAEPVIYQVPHGYNKGGIKYDKAPTLTANGSRETNNSIVEQVFCQGSFYLEEDSIAVGTRNTDKSRTLTAAYSRHARRDFEKDIETNGQLGSTGVLESVRIGTIGSESQAHRVYSTEGKSVNIVANGGGQGAKTGLYACPIELGEIVGKDGKTYPIYEVRDGLITIKEKQYPIKLVDGYYIIRKLTVLECMRLQTFDDYYIFPVSNTQAYKQLGNSWTIEVICHILSYIPNLLDNEVEVLSLYDGISAGQVALNRIGANVSKYRAYEIDKYAIETTLANFSGTIQLGDAFKIREDDWVY